MGDGAIRDDRRDWARKGRRRGGAGVEVREGDGRKMGPFERINENEHERSGIEGEPFYKDGKMLGHERVEGRGERGEANGERVGGIGERAEGGGERYVSLPNEPQYRRLAEY